MTATVREVVLKIASRCNLNCSYCYLYNHADRSVLEHPKKISNAVFDQTLFRMAQHADRHQTAIGLTFHGGEPTLVGAERFAALADRARQVLGARLRGITVQTNAMLIDARFAKVLRSRKVTVGVSLDGPPEVHDRVRVTHAGRPSHAETVRGIAHLQAAGIEVHVLCVIDPSQDGAAVYQHIRSLGVRVIDFLLPDVSHDRRDAIYGTAPHPVFDFIDDVLNAWLTENDPTVTVPILHDLLSSAMSGRVPRNECFGNPSHTYVVVNTDGSIEPLDALKVCRDGITNVGASVFDDSFDDLGVGNSILAKALTGRFALPTGCSSCDWRATCAGGYLPHRYSSARGFDNPSVWCSDIQLLLARTTEIARSYQLESN